jgi:hypothetical protein
MKQRPNPERIKGQIFQSIRSYVFVAWFPDLSFAIRIYSLAYLYYLKANRNQFSKYFEVYMILKDDCTKRPLLAIEVWSAEVETCNMRLFHPPLRLSIFYVSRDQPRPGSFLKKREEPGNEVDVHVASSFNLKMIEHTLFAWNCRRLLTSVSLGIYQNPPSQSLL